MWWLLWVGLAVARPGSNAYPGPDPLVPPPATYPGAFNGVPVPQWDVDLPGGPVRTAGRVERSHPVLDGDYVFVGSAAASGLFMLSRRDGLMVRHFASPAIVESEATIADGRVYFSDAGGTTLAYTLEGLQLWSHDSGSPVLARPAIVDDRLMITDVSGRVFALDLQSGTLVWQYRHRSTTMGKADLALFASPSPVAYNDQLLFGFSDGTLVALDKATGVVVSQRRVGEGRYPDLVATPLATPKALYVGGYVTPLLARDATTGQVQWRAELGAAAPLALASVDDQPLLLHPGSNGKLHAIHAITGETLWSWDSKTKAPLTQPIVTEAGVLVGASRGTLTLVELSTGKTRWRFNPLVYLSGMTATPAVSGRQVVFTTNAGRIYGMVVPQRKKKQRSKWDL